MFSFPLFLLFLKLLCSWAYAGYTGPELKMPMKPGSGILIITQAGGQVAEILDGGTDEYHTDSKNGYYSIDFDDRSSGESVLAAADGTVSSMVNSGCTNGGTMCYITIDHGGGYKSTYFHLVVGSIPSGIAVGSHVSMGDIIGTIGSTGISTGTHLHFSISFNGHSLSTTDELGGVELDGLAFVDYEAGGYYHSSNDGTCTLSPQYPMGLVTISENGSAFDFHQYYVQDRKYVLLNNGDMNTATRTYANPVILAQGSVAYHYAWLSGDVNGDSFDDIVEVQHFSSTQLSEVVWLSNGDGSFQSQVVWQMVTTDPVDSGQNHYFLGDVNNDGKDDLVIGRDEGSNAVNWFQCLSTGSSFSACTNWNGSAGVVTVGKVWANNAFLLGDVTGDGKADLVRGYNTSSQTDPNDLCADGSYPNATGYNLRWKVLPGGSATLSDFWGTNSGCLGSTYLLGDEDGDGLQDLIEVRFEAADIGHVYERRSTGTKFVDVESWLDDFGSPNFNYATYDVMGDYGKDALLSHSSGSGKKVRIVRVGDGEFKRTHVYNSSIGIEPSGAWLPGHYGDLKLKTGTEQVCEGSASSNQSYSPYEDGTLWDVDGTVYEYWTSDESWHGYASSDAFDACGNDWASIQEVSSSIFAWEPTGSVITDSFQCGVVHEGDVYAWNGTAYAIASDGTKRGFTTPDVFIGCGYAWGDLDFLSDEESPLLTTLSDSSPISSLGSCGYAEDLVWRELSSGNLAAWYMAGTGISSSSSISSSDLSWEVVGSADFNRDGSLDLLWRHLSSPYELYLWEMDGASVTSSVLIAGSTDPSWVIRGVSDFTSDGEPDILWKNQYTGELAIWIMEGTVISSSEQVVATSSDTSWDIRATGDLTGDGSPDILWRNPTTGALSLWQMDGTSYVSFTAIASSSLISWNIKAIGDFTSDGVNDLLWRNSSTGELSVWQMNGTSYVSSVSMTTSSAAWDLVTVGGMSN